MLGRSFVRRVEKAYQQHSAPSKQDIFIDYDNFSFHLFDEDGEALLYKPTPTALKFHQNDYLVRGIIGPYGSGKTTAMLADIIFRSCKMPIASEGKRCSRWAIIRNTYAELESTTYVSWISWFSNLGKVHRNKKPLLTVRHNFNDGNGDIELEVIFIALDSESDVRKLKSLEVCGIYLNECSEIPYAIFQHTLPRTGRYLMNQIPSYWRGVILDTNPPSEKHWIPTLFNEGIDSHVLFQQPPGLLENENGDYIANPDADNIERLGTNYYLENAFGKTQEFINVYCLGKYGTLINAKKIYEEYNDDIHSVEFIPIDRDLPLYIGMDFGLTPAAILVQETTKGIYNVVHELTTTRMGVKDFIENILNPFLSRNCSGMEIAAFVGDPAGEKKNENDLTSCFDALQEAGYKIMGASTNFTRPRIDAVRHVLTQLVEGLPKIIVSRRTSTVLREGFLGGYCYKSIKINGEKTYDDKPFKNEFSHIHDALQYIMLYLNSQEKRMINKIEIKPKFMRF
jgi:phage terminase large subunit